MDSSRPKKNPERGGLRECFPGPLSIHWREVRVSLDIFLEVLDENDRLSFQQEIESIFSSIDFQKSVDDEDDEKDSRENPEIDGRETSFYLILLFEQNKLRPYFSQDCSVGGKVFLGCIGPIGPGPCIICRKEEIPVPDTNSVTVPE